MGAVGEAALQRRAAHLAKRLRQSRRADGAQAEFVDAGAIDEESVPEPVEPSRRVVVWRPSPCRETSPTDRLAAQRAEDRTLADA